jgi:DinB family
LTSLLEHLQAMARNNAWANFRLLQACSQLTEEAYRARRTSFFPSIHLTLNHILVVDWYYLDALHNGGRRWREIHALDDAPCVRREQTAADRLLRPPDLSAARRRRHPAPAGRPPVPRAYPGRARTPVPARHPPSRPGARHAGGNRGRASQLDAFFLQQDAPLRADDLRALGLPQR